MLRHRSSDLGERLVAVNEDAHVHRITDSDVGELKACGVRLHGRIVADAGRVGIGVSPDPDCGELRALPALLALPQLRPRTRVDGDAPAGRGQHGVQVELGHGRQVVPECREAVRGR